MEFQVKADPTASLMKVIEEVTENKFLLEIWPFNL